MDLALPEHLRVVPGDAGAQLAPLLIAGQLGAVAGDVHVHRLQRVGVDAHADGQALAVQGGLALAQHLGDVLVHPVHVRHRSEVVAAEAAHPVDAELVKQYPGKVDDGAVALLKAVGAVVISEAHDVEVQHHGLPSLRQHTASGVRGQGEEAAHVGKVGQPVVVELVVQVVDGGLDLIAHPRERAGQRADLVSAVVVQVHVVVGVSQPLGGVGQYFQRPGDDAHHHQHQHHKEGDDAPHGQQYDPDQPGPGSVDLPGEGDADQLHAVGEGAEGHLPVLPGGGIADQLIAAALAPEDLRVDAQPQVVQVAGDGQVGMIDHPALRVQQAHEARIVDADALHLGHQGVAGDVHAHQADEHAGFVDGHEVGADPRAPLGVGIVGSQPYRPSAVDRGVCSMKPVFPTFM